MISVMEVYQLLPKTNCKRCCLSACMAFAFELLRERKAIEDCTPLVEEPKYEEKLEVHEERCCGCGNCVVACPMNVANGPRGTAIGRGPVSDKAILMVEDGVVKYVNVDQSRRFGPEKVICNACIVTCPGRAIEFV